MTLIHHLDLLEPRALFSTYYISPAGNDAAAGSASAPFATLQHAADRVVAGDVVNVFAGHYAGFQLTRSGTSSAPITFAAQSGAVIDRQNPKTADGINLEGASYAIVRGFTVTGLPRAGIRSVTNTGAQIIGNNIDSSGTWGILTGFSQNVLIENNTTSRSQQQHGIYVGNSADNPVIRGNISWGNANGGIQINSDASQGGDGIISGALIENNTVYGNGKTGGSAINLDGVEGAVIRNNLLYDNHASGISLFQQDGTQGAMNNLVINNTVVMANDSSSAGRFAVNIQNGSTGNRVLNNVLYSYFPRSGGGGSIAVSSDSTSGFVSDYNIVTDSNAFYRGSATMNFAAWKSQSGQDAHLMVSTPATIFSNISADDFSLKTASPAIDHGTLTSAPATDMLGKPRPSGASDDIGAYEMQSGTGGGDTGGGDTGGGTTGGGTTGGGTTGGGTTGGGNTGGTIGPIHPKNPIWWTGGGGNNTGRYSIRPSIDSIVDGGRNSLLD